MRELLEHIRDRAAQRGVQFMDIRYVATDSTNVSVEDGRADQVAQQVASAAGIRVLVDDAWGFASTDVITADALSLSLDAAVDMARASADKVLDAGVVAKLEPVTATVRAQVEKEPRSVPLADKVRRASDYERAGREAGGSEIVNSVVRYGDQWNREIVCNTAGTYIDIEDVRTLVIGMYAASDGQSTQRSTEFFAEQRGWELIEALSTAEFTEAAAKEAVALLSAKRCPSGKFTVLLDPSVAGVFAHEVLGHNAEADLVFAGTSIIEGKVGEKIGSDHVSIYNDSTIPYVYGSYSYDSEGIPAARVPIIQNGVLTGFLHSLETAARFGTQPTGNGRAQDGHSLPQVRMSNTFFEPGSSSLENLISEIDEGILIEDARGGYVYPERGTYTVSSNQGRMIRNGELAEPIRQVTFTGVLLETLLSVDGASDELELKPGMCGKGGQGVPVTTGGPYVRIRDVVVGGQE